VGGLSCVGEQRERGGQGFIGESAEQEEDVKGGYSRSKNEEGSRIWMGA
jgi:hypothetical protein